jgi:hypothetical protein
MIKDIVHEIHEISSDKKSVRKFGIILAVILLIVAGFMWRKDNALWIEFAGTAMVVGIIAVALPLWIKPVYYGMTVFSIVIGYFVSRLVLSVLFFLLFMPVGILTRIFRKDLLDKEIRREAPTYWLKKEKTGFVKEQYERLF